MLRYYLILESPVNQTKKYLKSQTYSGRYVLVFGRTHKLYAVNDAFGLRQIYFAESGKEGKVLSSSPIPILDFFKWQPELSPKIQNLLDNDDYKKNESPWVGEYWYDKRIKKVLPNHYLDLKTNDIQRIPFFVQSQMDDLIVENAVELFRGTYEAVSNRFDKLIQPITGGWDSRLLLAASKKFKDKIDYYVFINDPSELEKTDVIIGTRLAFRLDLNYNIISTRELRKDFLDKYRNICIKPRILPKTANIQWHYYNNSNKKVVNINGNGGEIIRRVYQYYEKEKGQADLNTLFKCRAYNWFFKSEIEKWYEQSVAFAKANNISILDLFYWEQRMGQWHALYQYEQDVAIEEFCPFNNKGLLLSILSLPPTKRSKYNSWVNFELMHRMWPEVTSVPINPILGIKAKKRIQNFLRKNPDLFSTIKRIKKLDFKKRVGE